MLVLQDNFSSFSLQATTHFHVAFLFKNVVINVTHIQKNCTNMYSAIVCHKASTYETTLKSKFIILALPRSPTCHSTLVTGNHSPYLFTC